MNKKISKISKYKIKNLKNYHNKRVLVGDYTCSAKTTKEALESFGIIVDIAPTIEKVIFKVKYEGKYDIIFSNNIYPHGTGKDCLNQLKKTSRHQVLSAL